MYIKDIELKNFRNYKELKLSFDKKINLILGHNAQGKTNLIEAIYLASMGKSFRTSKDRELIKFDENTSLIRINGEKEEDNTEIEIIIEKKGSNSSIKNIKKDKKRLNKTSELIKNIIIVVFSPEDLKIIKDEPEKRRRYLDREICQISTSYYENYSNYKKILIQRNTYLREKDIDKDILDIWDRQMAEYGSKIIHKRKEFIEKISEISSKIHRDITGGEERLEIKYDSNVRYEEDLKDQEYYFYKKIKQGFEVDRNTGTSSVGPHRDDILFFVNEVNMRKYGSQGQQRTCALSLKLAELSFIKEETGEEGILILDDVMSELDNKRQEFLIKSLKANQLFITTTDMEKEILEKIGEATIYSVKDGIVEKKRV